MYNSIQIMNFPSNANISQQGAVQDIFFFPTVTFLNELKNVAGKEK